MNIKTRRFELPSEVSERTRTKLRIPNIETARFFQRRSCSFKRKRRPQADAFFWGENFRELECCTGVFGSAREAYDDPLAARSVRLRVSGAQAMETIMPINKTPARIIMV